MEITVERLKNFRIALLELIQQYRTYSHVMRSDTCPLCLKAGMDCSYCIYNILYPTKKLGLERYRCRHIKAPKPVDSKDYPQEKSDKRADWIEFKVIPKLDKLIEEKEVQWKSKN